MIKIYLHFDYEGDDWQRYFAADTEQADDMLLKLSEEDNDFCYHCYYTSDGSRRTARDVKQERQNNMGQIEQIAKVLKSNLVRLDCWDWKNDTFNEAYVADCDKVAQMLYDQGIRVIEREESNDR